MSNPEQRLALTFLCQNIHDFKEAARLLEAWIRKANVDENSDACASMKAVSHFNLGTSLELMFKLMLRISELPYDNTHGLVKLYSLLPNLEKVRLNRLSQDIGCNTKMVAYLHFEDPANPPVPPARRRLSTLEDILEYFDQDVMVYKARYSYEQVERLEARHYMEDISFFIEFIHRNLRHLSSQLSLRAAR